MNAIDIYALQLFATPVNRTVDDGGTHNLNGATNDLSADMKTFYDLTLIDEAQANLVHDQFAQKRPIPKGSGKIIEFRKFAPLAKALTPITEGVTPDGNTLTVTTINSEVSQYGDYIVQSDILELTALDNTILEATKLLGRQAGMTLDTVTRNVLQAGTNVNYASKWSGTTETRVTSRANLDDTSIFKVDTINQVVAKLRARNAPTINGKYVAIIHPYVAYDLMRDPEWIDSHKYATPENQYAGEIGEIGGVRFVQSSEAKIIGPAALRDGLTRLVIADDANTSATTVYVEGSLTTGSGLSIPCYINGVANTITAIAAGTDTHAGQSALTVTALSAGVSAGQIVAGKGGTKSGGAIFCTLIMGAGAYGVTEITGGGLQTIIKQKGSAGTADPLDQRSSVGWKAIKTAELLVPDYLVRVESVSPRFSPTAETN